MTALPPSPFISAADPLTAESPLPSIAPDKPRTEAGLNSVSPGGLHGETAAATVRTTGKQMAAADILPDIPEFLRRRI